jgi:hypothetical protein
MGFFKSLVKVVANPAKAIVDSNKKSEVQKRNDAMVCNVVASIQADYKKEPDSKKGRGDQLHYGYVQARMYEAINCKKTHTVPEAEKAYGDGWKYVDLFSVEGRSIGQAFKQVAPVIVSAAVGTVTGGPVLGLASGISTGVALSNKYKKEQQNKFNDMVYTAVNEKRLEDQQLSSQLQASLAGDVGGIPVILLVVLGIVFLFFRKK